MKVHQTFLTIIFAPLAGVLLYLWLIGQFETMAGAPTSGLLGFVFIGWVVAMMITLIVGFPLGFGFSAILRRFYRESLFGYLFGAICLSIILTFLVGEPEVGVGFATTGVLLALGYWFFVAKPRGENDIA